MKITDKTTVKEVTKKYPWLLGYLAKKYPAVHAINNPIGRRMISGWTVKDISKKFHVSPETLQDELEKIINEH